MIDFIQQNDKQRLRQYAVYLQRALDETDDLGEATMAAEVALAVDEADGVFLGMVGDEWHGPTAPGPGWIVVRTGERGGKVWKRGGGQRVPPTPGQQPKKEASPGQPQRPLPPRPAAPAGRPAPQQPVQPVGKVKPPSPRKGFASLNDPLPDQQKLQTAPFKAFGETQHGITGDIGRVNVEGRDYFFKDSLDDQQKRGEIAASSLGMTDGVTVPRARWATVPSVGKTGVLTNWSEGKSLYELENEHSGDMQARIEALRRGEDYKEFDLKNHVPESEIDKHLLFGYLYDIGDNHAGNFMVEDGHLLKIDNETFMNQTTGNNRTEIREMLGSDLFLHKSGSRDYPEEKKFDKSQVAALLRGTEQKAAYFQKMGFPTEKVEYYKRRAGILKKFALGDGKFSTLERLHNAEFKEDINRYRSLYGIELLQ